MPRSDVATPARLGFQSTPAITGGRCNGNRAAAGCIQVSIHARHYWRAMRAFHGSGEFAGVVSIHARHYWRAMHGRCRRRQRHAVSIHARHYWRAMPQALRSIRFPGGFQSTPAITGGRCCSGGSWGGQRRVSIHARHYWRAMPSTAQTMFSAPACFNPRPPLLAGDAKTPRQSSQRSASFNPRPPLLAGDASHCGVRQWRGTGFNPRPPLLAGDARPCKMR